MFYGVNDKLTFLKNRYQELYEECKARNFNVTYIWPETLPDDENLWLDYIPTENAMRVNKERIQERMPVKPRFTRR